MSRKPRLASSQSSFLRDSNTDKTPLKPKVFVQNSRIVPSPTSVNTIANLSLEEKEKVARLVSRLVKLEQEHEEVLVTLQREKDAFRESTARLQAIIEEQMPVISEKLKSKEDEINELEIKSSLSSGLLALYQAKLKNSSDMLRFHEVAENDKTILINRLESDLYSLQSLVASQKIAIESFEASRTHAAHSLQEFQVRSKATVDRLEADKRDLTARLAHAEQQVHILQNQLLEHGWRSKELVVAAEAVRGAVPPSVVQYTRSRQSQSTDADSIESRAVAPAPKGDDIDATMSSMLIQTDGVHSVVPQNEQQQQQQEHQPNEHQQQPAGDMYDPLYASFDTISFTSSHHYQHSRNGIEDSVLADSADEERDFRSGGNASDRSDRSLRGTEQWSNALNGHRASATTTAGVVKIGTADHSRMHTALDPTPMKRRSDRLTVPPAAVPAIISSVPLADTHEKSSSHRVATLDPHDVSTTGSNAVFDCSRSSNDEPRLARRLSQRPAPQGRNNNAISEADGGAVVTVCNDARDERISAASELPLPTARTKTLKQGSSSHEGALGLQKNEKKKKLKPAVRREISSVDVHDEVLRPALVTKKNKSALGTRAAEPSRHHTFSASTLTTHQTLPHPSASNMNHDAAHTPPSQTARVTTTTPSTGKAKNSSSANNKKVATAIKSNAAITSHFSIVHPKQRGKSERVYGQDVNYDESLFTLLSDLEIP